MKRLNLNPTGRTVYKITQPGVEAVRQAFTLEPMRFLFPFEAKKEANAVKINCLKHRWYGQAESRQPDPGAWER